MDIIDIMIAKALTPQGQIDTYASRARQAVANANAAATTASTTAETLEGLVSSAQTTLSNAQDALAAAQNANANYDTIADTEINKIGVAAESINESSWTGYKLDLTTADGTHKKTEALSKLAKETGNNEDRGMTQKAITDALQLKADKSYVDQSIANIPASGGNGGGGVSNLGSEQAGHIVVIGSDGTIIAGDITEEALVQALIRSNAYECKGTLGLVIDYENKSFIRTQDAATLDAGSDFNSYSMFGGRMRCNVSDSGEITAFYGETGYKEDGSNGQVMVYQPKFYYQRTLLKTENNIITGKIVRKESLILSPKPQTGFKLHPLFKQGDTELEYVLLPAFDSSLNDNKLQSIAGAKPISSITINQAETYATNRGTGWHVTNMAAESAQQMLEMVEFGTLNGQAALEEGVVNITNNSSINCASFTGSTSALGNTTGNADSTINESNGAQITYNIAGKRAITYRGVENPWGNIWHMIGGTNVYGNGTQAGGIAYICSDFNYNTTTINNSNYSPVGFNLPGNTGWISAMGYGSDKYDWVYLPAECSDNANSALPVGDTAWTVSGLSWIVVPTVGGSWASGSSAGPFYYGFDRSIAQSAQTTYGVKLMYIPTVSATYTSNYNKWLAKIQG